MADKRKILKMIQQAAKDGRTELDLSGNQLTEVPEAISELTNLTTLYLSGNQLKEVPKAVSSLTNLTTLYLSYNQLAEVPEAIGGLTNLTALYLSGNQLTEVPEAVSSLTNLTTLYLSYNQLAEVSEAVSRLTNLTALYLNDNHLKEVPKAVSRLTNLIALDLSGNQLTEVPEAIGGLTNLTALYLSYNQLKEVPEAIGGLTNLTALDLSGNQLTKVPKTIGGLTNLTTLDLGDNQLPIPPESLADPKDVKTIFAAIAGLAGGERLNEAKMLVVGDGKVGKSSVVEQLIYGTFNPQKQTTLGVKISDEMKIVQGVVQSEGEPVKLNIWDFGGQEIQHSTHQFFLTMRSLYLLVVDARKGDQIHNIEYWLKLIESFGGDSPIIVVINQIDQLKGQRPLNLDRKTLQDKYNIKDFIEASCATGDGIPELKSAIANYVEMKHVRDIWPREWLAIKRRLKDMQADYIPVEKYYEICGEEKLNDEDLRQSLLGLLHDLGSVIRFPGDTHVLNPRWVTQGVYGLLTSADLVKAQGQFDLKDMGEVLAGLPDAKKHYPSHTHRRLIDVMRHFELCFEFTDRRGHYLIPRHLHDNELDIPWNDDDALKFQYHYVETLPDAIISRFIVRTNQYISERHYWKNGVFLRNGENRAKIKADLVDRKIFIAINGKEQTRRAFLAVIRSSFDEIHKNFKIDIKQMIPVPAYPQILVSYQDLLAYEEMNEQQIIIPELRKKFPVKELLDGIEDLSRRLKRRKSHFTEKGFSKPQPRIFRIVVASPNDVKPERDVLPSVIDELNRGVAADYGLHLILSRWETDTYPGFHPEGPQGVIDLLLKITDCDLLIGIFWKRFGTPTADGKTGTEHEFNLAYETWQENNSPQIFVYFNEKPYTPKSKTEIEQWGQVLDFRERFPKEGLWWPYKGKPSFEKLVRNHLTNYIRSFS